MTSLDGRIVLVTGATRGIGRAIATHLAKEGAFVFGTATTPQGALEITNYLEAAQLAGKGLCLDVTAPEQIEQLADSLAETNQSPAILVNNAGITCDNLLLRMDDAEWYKVIETNLNAVFRLCRAFVKPMFRARFGRIISIGSVVGSSGNAGQVNYTAAKAGIVGFSKSLAQEMGSRNITVNVVAPGFIETDMTAALPDLVKEQMLKQIPLRQFGKVEDVAAAVAFLASEAARYITGATIPVNGGMYME